MSVVDYVLDEFREMKNLDPETVHEDFGAVDFALFYPFSIRWSPFLISGILSAISIVVPAAFFGEHGVSAIPYDWRTVFIIPGILLMGFMYRVGENSAKERMLPRYGDWLNLAVSGLHFTIFMLIFFGMAWTLSLPNFYIHGFAGQGLAFGLNVLFTYVWFPLAGYYFYTGSITRAYTYGWKRAFRTAVTKKYLKRTLYFVALVIPEVLIIYVISLIPAPFGGPAAAFYSAYLFLFLVAYAGYIQYDSLKERGKLGEVVNGDNGDISAAKNIEQ
ncbi:MAG: hypothetical protein ABEK59_10885 [Halobacteria archaeon]